MIVEQKCHAVSHRLKVVLAGFIFLFSLLALRLSWISLRPMTLLNIAANQNVRGIITDRHGHILATSLSTYSVYAHPQKISDKEQTVQALHQLFPHLKVEFLRSQLCSRKTFVWIVRHITPQQHMALKALGIEGLEARSDCKRIYPHGRLFSHVIGTTDVDQRGISGLEKFFDRSLAYQNRTLRTSLDVRLQHIVYDALQQQMQEFQAGAGNAVLADIQTGEILAMVSFPDFAPADVIEPQNPAFFNRNTNGVYEFGSIMKIINTALFLESHAGDLHSVFNASKPLRIGRFSIKDFRGLNRSMTVEESFMHSSNIVHAQMALSVGGEKQKKFFRHLGFMEPLRLELCESARPLISQGVWSKACVMTAGYGYGFAVSPLQAVSGIRTVVSGFYTPLTLIAEPKLTLEQRISSDTARSIVYLMGRAVQDGQAKRAAAFNCLIGAKTGTANLRSADGSYREGENLASCVSIFPLEKPRYILLVSIERARASKKTYGFATGGWFAAPVVAKIVEMCAPVLGLLIPQNGSGTAALAQQQAPTKKEKHTSTAVMQGWIRNILHHH